VSHRILIVDDEAPLRRTLERALRGWGCDVVSAGDAHVAYQLLDEADVDLVLLDLHLPQMSGATFYLALARRWPRLADRIVLMTGDTFAEKDHWPAELRRCPLLLKPFTLDLLRSTVLDALDGPAREGRASSGPA
jgi:DNA-binding NtrC family response regulator